MDQGFLFVHPAVLQPLWVRDVQSRQQKEAASKPAPVNPEAFPRSLNEVNSQSVNQFFVSSVPYYL